MAQRWQFVYQVEQGLWSPRDESYTFRVFALYPEKEMALCEAKRLKVARVLECRLIKTFGIAQ